MPASQTLQFLEQALGAQHLLVLFLCVYATWRVAHARQRKALQAVHTRAAAVAAAAAAIATSECFTAEWVNQLLRAVWPTSLEPKIAAKLSASLDTAFAKILKERGHKGPLKYVEGICVERVCLGKQPPLLRMVRAQSSPADNSLRLDFGVGFAPAEGFSVVLALLVRPAKMLPAISAHVELANVSLKGQCRLALTLAPDKAPGISGAMVSFSQAPAIDFDFVPFGLPIGELPYVLDMLKDQLQVVLNAKMVEPNRMSVSFGQTSAAKKSIHAPAGTAMIFQVPSPALIAETVSVAARRRWAAWRPWGARVSAVQTSTLKHEVLFDGSQPADQITSIRADAEESHHGRGDEVDSLASVELQADDTLADAGILLDDRLDIAANAHAKQSAQLVVNVTAACGNVPADASKEAFAASKAKTTLPEDRTNMHAADTIGSGEPPIDRSSHSLPLGPLQHQATSAEMITAGSKQSEFDSLRMEKEGELAACKALSDVEGSLEALRKRVAAERLRALVEGAPFLVHAASGTRERFVWFSQLQKALIWADDKVVNGENSTAHTFSLARDSKVTAGAAGVPQQVAGKLHPWRGLPMKLWKSGSASTAIMAKPAPDDARTFSVISSDDRHLHLELPKHGNGRSRREWMDAILDIINEATADMAAAGVHP